MDRGIGGDLSERLGLHTRLDRQRGRWEGLRVCNRSVYRRVLVLLHTLRDRRCIPTTDKTGCPTHPFTLHVGTQYGVVPSTCEGDGREGKDGCVTLRPLFDRTIPVLISLQSLRGSHVLNVSASEKPNVLRLVLLSGPTYNKGHGMSEVG